MSAIFGIVNKKGDAIDADQAATMQGTLLHRSVDGKGMVTDDEVMFGHHKLIVHRRQTNEVQPFEYEDCIITCDARIDNTEELRKELELPVGPELTDSLIIVKAYKKWGSDCASRLEGEFAFAIWDKVTKSFYAACDHIGFRTFYYYENADFLAFASTIKALESIKTEPLEINEQIFLDCYTNVLHPITYDKNIRVLQSAHYLLFNKNEKIKLIRYWLAKAANKYKFKHSYEWHDCVRELATKKIECMLDTDYPIGILLSGGLDSSFVCAIACPLLKKQNKKLHAFCSVLPENYKGEDKDERFYIEKLKERFDNLELHYVSIPENTGPYSDLTKAFERVEYPVNAFHYVESALFDYAKQHHVRTLLTGFGGDMTISYNGNGVIYQYLGKGKFLKAFELFFKRYRLENYSFSSLIKMEILGHNPVYRKVRDFIKPPKSYSYLPLKKEMIEKINQTEEIPNKQGFFAGRLNESQICSLLIRCRKHAAAFNLEFLSPILCKEITELFFDIPGEQLMLDGMKRSLIKGAMKNTAPLEIINRRDKMPFSPDYNKKIAAIAADYYPEKYFRNNVDNTLTGIDFNSLSNLISQIKMNELKSEWIRNDNLFYIPIAFISAEYHKWVCL